MGIYFNPELTRNAETPAVEAVLLLQRQLRALTNMQDEVHRDPQSASEPLPVSQYRAEFATAPLLR